MRLRRGAIALVSAHKGERFIDMDADAAEDLRDRGRLILCSLAWMAASVDRSRSVSSIRSSIVPPWRRA